MNSAGSAGSALIVVPGGCRDSKRSPDPNPEGPRRAVLAQEPRRRQPRLRERDRDVVRVERVADPGFAEQPLAAHAGAEVRDRIRLLRQRVRIVVLELAVADRPRRAASAPRRSTPAVRYWTPRSAVWPGAFASLLPPTSMPFDVLPLSKVASVMPKPPKSSKPVAGRAATSTSTPLLVAPAELAMKNCAGTSGFGTKTCRSSQSMLKTARLALSRPP